MSWNITARTHTEISDAVSRLLVDTGESIWDDANKNQAIKDALQEISEYRPYNIKDTSKTMTANSKVLDVSGIKDIIRIRKAEYFVDKDPLQFRNVEWIDSGNIRILTDIEPASGDSIYLYIDKRHHLDPLWVASTAYVKGDIVSPTKANRTGYRYECTTAGTSSSSEPTWGTTVGGTTSDGTVTWTCRGELPNSLKDGKNDLEDIFIRLVAARLRYSRATYHANRINVGSSRALEQYLTLADKELSKVLADLRAIAIPNTKEWYPLS